MALRKQAGKSKGTRETDVSLGSQEAGVQDVRHGFKDHQQSTQGVRPVRSDKGTKQLIHRLCQWGPPRSRRGSQEKDEYSARLVVGTYSYSKVGSSAIHHMSQSILPEIQLRWSGS